MSSLRSAIPRLLFLAPVLLAADGCGRSCTLMYVEDGLRVSFNEDGLASPGLYRVELSFDGDEVICEAGLPQTDTGATDPYDFCDDERVRLDVSSALAATEDQRISGLHIAATPETVEVAVYLDDVLLKEATLSPSYTTSEPNGEGCGEATQGAEILEVPEPG